MNGPNLAHFSSSTSSLRASKDQIVSVMDPTDDSVFTAGLDDVTTMSRILHELYHTDDHSVLVITGDGIRLITAGEKTFQVSAFFARYTFQRFKFDAETHQRVHFRFMLRDFIESLNLLRDDPIVNEDKLQLEESTGNDMIKTSLYIQYRKKGEPLKLRLENKSNYVINCDLKAFNLPGDSMFCPLAFSHDEETAVILLSSKKFYEYASGLDFNSSEFLHLVMGRGSSPIKMSTKSTVLGEVELEITSNETEIIKREIIVSDNCLFSFTYRTQFIKPAIEALKTSTYMQMKCGSSGLLCIEHFHVKDRFNEGPFMRQDPGGYLSANGENSLDILLTDYNQPQNKRSSVEYFILSEARPIDACPDLV